MIAPNRSLVAAVLVCALAVGCEEAPVESAFEIETSGVVRGSVFVDLNGNGVLDPNDSVLPGLSVQVVQAGTSGVAAAGATDGLGGFFIDRVPVGRFTIDVSDASLPDSLIVLGLPATPFLLGAGDTVTVGFRASFPTHSLAELPSLPLGRRVFTSGFALNPRNPAGDGAVHLALQGSYLRATGVDPSTVAVGDSVRFSGVTSIEAGLPVLSDVRVFVLRPLASIPTPLERSTLVASNAGAGTINAALVRVREADVVDTTFVNGNLIATIDDGSGPLDLVLRSFLGINPDPLDPGFARVTSATGILVAEPLEGGGVTWRLLPRSGSDLSVESFPLRTVGEARALASGVGVTVRGVVLNPVDGPTAGTIHLEQDGAYIRVRSVTGIAPTVGDTIQVRGRTARSVQRPVVDALGAPTVLGFGPPPVPETILPPDVTLRASTANGGSADAALVRLQNVSVTATVVDDGAGNFVATLDDGSGEVDLVVTPAALAQGVSTVGVVPGAVLEHAIGLLVPRLDLGVPEWRIFPRSGADLLVAP